MGFNNVDTGTQPKMKGITQNNFGSDPRDVSRQHALHSPIGSHRHKRRSFNRAPVEDQSPAPCEPIGSVEFETHLNDANLHTLPDQR